MSNRSTNRTDDPKQRPTIYTMNRVLELVQKHGKVTAGGLAKALQVSLRTVTRDLSYLIEVLGIPLEWDHQARSHILKTESLPPITTLILTRPFENMHTEMNQLIAEYGGQKVGSEGHF